MCLVVCRRDCSLVSVRSTRASAAPRACSLRVGKISRWCRLPLSKKIIFDGDKRAVGVEVIGPDGNDYTFTAKYEVIILRGIFESPKLLMLSGIGRKADLEEKGITTLVDSEHMSQNLLDHPIFSHVFKIKDGYGLDSHMLRAGPQHDGAVASYRKNHTGPYSSGLLELVAFPRADD